MAFLAVDTREGRLTTVSRQPLGIYRDSLLRIGNAIEGDRHAG
jgi:hypothetical protein